MTALAKVQIILALFGCRWITNCIKADVFLTGEATKADLSADRLLLNPEQSHIELFADDLDLKDISPALKTRQGNSRAFVLQPWDKRRG